MTTIWKFPFSTSDCFTIEMPTGTTVLSVQTQFAVPCLWALVDPAEQRTVAREFRVYGTGHHIAVPGEYVGTYQEDGGSLVWHLFDEGPKK